MKTVEQLIQAVKKEINEVTVHGLFDAIKSNDTILIDVREPDEFKAGAIAQAINYPRGVLEMRIHQHPLIRNIPDAVHALQQLKNQAVYLICGTSGLSALASYSLQMMGFTQVVSVQGGYQAWIEQGYPVKKPNEHIT